jgi:hypothetical protein
MAAASFASPTTGGSVAVTPKQQIAALKKQIRALQAQVKDLQGNVKLLNGRVAALQKEASLIPQLAEIAALTAKYRSIEGAVADGYVQVGPACIPRGGTHYVKPSLANDDLLDPLQPDTLMYARVGGALKLVAVEYSVPTRYARPASFLGGTFEQYSGALGGPPVWYVHIWLWHLNPAGLFSAENSTVEC